MVIKDYGNIISWSQGDDYNAKLEEDNSFTTSQDKPEGDNQKMAKESQTHLSGKQDL